MIHTCHTNNQIYVSEKLRQKIAQAQRTWNQSNEAPSAAPISGLGLPGSKAVPYLPGPARGLNHHDGDTTPSGAFHTGSLSQSKPHGHQQRGHAPWVTYRRRHRFLAWFYLVRKPYHTCAGQQEGSTTMMVTPHLLLLFTLVLSRNLNHTDTNSMGTRLA